jgi:SAM-dependent methyltransferase
MDRAGNSRNDLEAALSDIALANRYLGGVAALLAAAAPHLAPSPPERTLEILDVGTGGADLPQALVRHARDRGATVRVTAVDLDPATASVAASRVRGEPAIRVVRADARRLPFRERTFDLVCASLFLHHFRDDEVVAILRRMAAACRGVVLVNDLQRHRVPWAFIAAAARLTMRHPMFVHDAPLSVLRGFTETELAALGARAGLRNVRVDRRWPFRLVLTANP